MSVRDYEWHNDRIATLEAEVERLREQVRGQFAALRDLQNAILGEANPTSTGYSQRRAITKANRYRATFLVSGNLEWQA